MSRVLCPKDRRSYNERKEYVDYLVEHEVLSAKELEILSTWLLFSKDIQSGRKLEYKFHRSEKHRREYKEATGVTLLSDMADFAHNEQEELNIEWLTEAVFNEPITANEKERVVFNYDNYVESIKDESLLSKLNDVIVDVYKGLYTSDNFNYKYIEIVDYLRQGLSKTEIARKIGVSKSNLSKTIKKIFGYN